MESGIDGSQASRLVRDYFYEIYGLMGVYIFEIKNVSYNSDEKAWAVECSFFRTLASNIKSFYEVIIHADGKIGRISEKTE